MIFVTKLKSGFGIFDDQGHLHKFSKREMYSMTAREVIEIVNGDVSE